MNTIYKLEKKFGKYAISNLTKYIIILYAIGFFFDLCDTYMQTNILSWIEFEPYLIMHGQVWRILSWLLIPPSSLNIFTIIMLLLYYNLGNALEQTWGTFKYNLFIFSGFFFTIIGGVIFYVILCMTQGSTAFLMGTCINTYYINLTIFLAFAASYPDYELMLYFLIPIKIKWLAIIDLAYLAFEFMSTGWNLVGWGYKVTIIASILNFILFYFATKAPYASPKSVKRRKTYRKQVNEGMRPGATKHKCAICGRTEKDGDDLVFRFCSKCDGNYEYCQDHLFTHTHVKHN